MLMSCDCQGLTLELGREAPKGAVEAAQPRVPYGRGAIVWLG